jgi:fluoride exporter
MNWLWVGLGGFLGANCRYFLSAFIARLIHKPLLPYGTITVNILGCFAIGFLAALAYSRHQLSPAWSLFILVGFLGGFTTFSSFGLEAFELVKQQHIIAALIDIILQVGLGMIAVALGFWVSLLATG